jgi:hypothetical protein
LVQGLAGVDANMARKRQEDEEGVKDWEIDEQTFQASAQTVRLIVV